MILTHFYSSCFISNSALLRLDAQLCELGLLYLHAQAMKWSNDVRRNIVHTPTIASFPSRLWKRSCCPSIARKIWLSITSLLRLFCGPTSKQDQEKFVYKLIRLFSSTANVQEKANDLFALKENQRLLAWSWATKRSWIDVSYEFMWRYILFATLVSMRVCYEWAVDHDWKMFAFDKAISTNVLSAHSGVESENCDRHPFLW